MDISQFEFPDDPNEWIQLIFDFGLLFLGGSVALLLIFCVFLAVNGSMGKEHPPPPAEEETPGKRESSPVKDET